MESKDLVLPGKKRNDGKSSTRSSPGKVSKVVIGEELKRAITELRSVPILNWNVDPLTGSWNNPIQLESSNLVVEKKSTNGAKDALPKPEKTRSYTTVKTAEGKTTVRPKDGSSRRLLSDGVQHFQLKSSGEESSDFMRRNSITIENTRLDRISDSACRIMEESATSVHMSMFPRDKRGKEKVHKFSTSSIGKGSIVSNGKEALRCVLPPSPPMPLKSDQAKSQRDQRSVKGKSNAVFIRNGDDNADIYERSMDVLEREDLQEEKECPRTRSESPDTLLEQLLDSIPAEVVDDKTIPPAADVFKVTAKNPKVKGERFALQRTAQDVKWGEKKNLNRNERNFQKATEKKSTRENAKIENVNNSNNIKISKEILGNRKEVSQSSLGSGAEPRKEPPSSLEMNCLTTPVNHPDLTPEEIFEEIMNFMEISEELEQKTRFAGSHNASAGNGRFRGEENLQHEIVHDSVTCDHLLENEWLSEYYDQIGVGQQHFLRKKMETETERVYKNPTKNSTPITTEKSKQTTEEVVKLKSVTGPQSDESHGRLPEAMAGGQSQDTLKYDLRRKPIPPLKETVHKTVFLSKDSMKFEYKKPPLLKKPPSESHVQKTEVENFYSDSTNLDVGIKNHKDTEILCSHLKTKPEKSHTVSCLKTTRNEVSSWKTPERTDVTVLRNPVKKQDTSQKQENFVISSSVLENMLPDFDEAGMEDVDLDLDLELSRNLEACTSSDLECQSIDDLMMFEVNSTMNAKAVGQWKKPKQDQTKLHLNLGENLAKMKPKRTHVTEQKKVIHRSEFKGNSDDSMKSEWQHSTRCDGKDNSRYSSGKNLLGKDSEDVTTQTSSKISLKNTNRISDDSSDSEENYDQTIIRRPHSVEKESPQMQTESQGGVQVLSEEITSQEILLKFEWSKRETKDAKDVRIGKPPFRELQLQRVLRMCDIGDDDSSSTFSKDSTCNRPALCSTPQLSGAVQGGETVSKSDGTSREHNEVMSVRSPVKLEYEKQTGFHKTELVSDSAVDVFQQDAVQVLRVPSTFTHTVPGIKDVVENVGSILLDDFERLPSKRNIRVTCEAVESKSKASLHERDVTVIHNTILDTYRSDSNPRVQETTAN